jgi:hypothetical protein
LAELQEARRRGAGALPIRAGRSRRLAVETLDRNLYA